MLYNLNKSLFCLFSYHVGEKHRCCMSWGPTLENKEFYSIYIWLTTHEVLPLHSSNKETIFPTYLPTYLLTYLPIHKSNWRSESKQNFNLDITHRINSINRRANQGLTRDSRNLPHNGPLVVVGFRVDSGLLALWCMHIDLPLEY